MCQSLQPQVPGRLAALRDALQAQEAPRLREAGHKCCGLLSEFSTAAGDLTANLEEVAAGAQLHQAGPVLERLETIVRELLTQVNGLTIEALQH